MSVAEFLQYIDNINYNNLYHNTIIDEASSNDTSEFINNVNPSDLHEAVIM